MTSIWTHLKTLRRLEWRKMRQDAPRAVKQYVMKDLRRDGVAGLTVAIMGVPQAMAYAMIAGLPPVYGLYTAIITCIIAALVGSSSHLVTGPTNAMCMVILGLTAHLPKKYDIDLIEIVLLLTILTGVFQMLFGILNLGGILRYVSNSVVVGFTAGAGILIAGNQLKNVMGVTLPEKEHVDRFHEVLYDTLMAVPDINPYALGIGVLTAAMIVLLPKISKKLPAALMAVAVSGLIVYAFGWHDDAKMGERKVHIVNDIEMKNKEGEVVEKGISNEFNMLRMPQLIAHPNYELTRELGTGALALAILGLIEAASIARAVSASSGQRLNFTREFVGQGAANIFGGFFSAFAGSGSFTRTAVNYKAGARTRMAAVFSAVITALTILLFAPYANYIPTASLAGMLIVIAYSMVEKHRLKLAWTSGKNSRMVLSGTLLSTLILPLEYAIFVGVFLSIVFLLKITGKTDLTQLVPRSDSGFDEVPFNRAAPSPIVTVNMEGDLYFAAVEDLDYELQRSLTNQTRVVVLRMKRLRAVGSTAMAILEHFHQMLHNRGIHMVVCGLEPQLVSVMTKSGLRQKIGEPNIFFADNKLFQSTELAMARALSIVEMERRREDAESKHDTTVPKVTGLVARDLITRNCIRFGNQHQLREAVWLMSQMLKRMKTHEPQPLFLQDREGRMAGVLSVWRLLEAMTKGVDFAELKQMSDHDLGHALERHFQEPISGMARTDLPRYKLDMPFGEMLAQCVSEDLRVLAVCDDGGRVVGLINQNDLLGGLGKVLHMEHDSVPQPKSEASDEDDEIREKEVRDTTI
jgi:sulfate permease, SulP family